MASIINHRITENFILIYADKNLNEHRIFQSLINTIKLSSNPDELRKFIHQIKDEKLFLIISGSFGEKFVPEIEIQSQIYSIYIYCNQKEHHEKWAKNYQKVKGVYTNLRSIYDAIRRDIRQANTDLVSFTILPSINSNELEQLFISSLLSKEILINNPSNEQVKREFIEFSRLYYADNPFELNLINQYEHSHYKQISPIVWYTRECFLYSMINRALRLNDIEILNKISFFIGDLHRQIHDLHIKSTDNQKLIVYYGQGISKDQFQKLNININGLILFDNFFLTTIDKEPSLYFAKQSINNSNLISILFHIEIDRSKSSFPFVVLDDLDYHHDTDRHILFSLNPVFRIVNIERIEEKLYQINLILIDDKEEKMKNLHNLAQKEFQKSKGFLSLGHMMIKTNQFDKAKDVFQILLTSTTADDQKQLAYIHRYLGYINEKLEDFSNALSHYKACLNTQLRYLPANHSSISSVCACIGMIQKKQGNLDQAFDNVLCALQIDVNVPKPNAVVISNHINNIGLIFKEQRKYSVALNCFERALRIQRKFLSPDDLSLTNTFNNIGEVYLSTADYSKAVQYFQEALKIQQKSDSSQPAIIAEIHHNLSIAFYNLGQCKDADEHASKAMNIARQVFGEKHDLVKKYRDQHDIIIQRK